jgi:acyl-CoA synthetase (NDP forming)
VLVFHDTASCFESLACCFNDGLASVAALPERDGAALSPHHIRLLEQPAAVLSEADSAALLQAFSVPMVRSRSASDAEQAATAAAELGYPVVLKAMAPGVAHKFKEGLVSLDIGSDVQLRQAFKLQLDRIHALGVQAGTFWLIQPMRRGALELLLGTSHEKGLGDFLVMGLGGVHAEIWNEVQLVAMPASSLALQAALSRSRAGRLLAGIDDSGRLSRQAVDALRSLQSLVMSAKGRIESVEINPFLVAGSGCVAVDGLVVTR